MKARYDIALRMFYLTQKSCAFLHHCFPFLRPVTLALARHSVYEMWQAISIEAYNVCNLKCEMCPYKHMTRPKEQMDMGLYKKIIDDAIGSGIRYIKFSFFNEPFLDSLVFERIAYTKERGGWVFITSNGTLLDEDKRTKLLELDVNSIVFSFDGATKETYERIRVGSNFENTRNNIIQLVRERNRRGLSKPTITVSMTVQEDNYSEVSEFRRMWSQFADYVTTWPVNGYFRQPATHRKPYPCVTFSRELMLVMSNGKVPLCCWDYDGSVHLGDLRIQTIREVANSATFKEISELHFSGKGDQVEFCKGCSHLYSDHCEWWLRLLLRLPPISAWVSRVKR